ncbi:Putative SET domain, JmjC domain, SET domain superfamily protein [Colletotrichum destructivum]|uniref:SET domain, JmjC domain, SET domain superfamily protein n=1 Tax=Colletotrichum destructivum TaxID=34406 RepID=A0AAX4I0Y5_9PEZI|nr:Putative SET domain, JmjC domain, SET domain superfamily protein [Colletotrichum destructivum]
MKSLLAQMSADLQEVKRKVSRSSSGSAQLAHRPPSSVGTSAIVPSSLPDSSLAIHKQRSNDPASADQSPAQCPDHQSQSAAPGEQAKGDPSSAERNTDTTTSTSLADPTSNFKGPSPPAPEGSEAASATASRTNSSVEAPSPSARTKFSLTTNETGPRLIPNIRRMLAEKDFNGHIRVTDMEPVDWDALANRLHKPEMLAAKASIVGEISVPNIDFISLLHPGEEFLQFAAIPGGNSDYWHAGCRLSGTPWHKEDANWRSVNKVCSGLKLWVVVPAHYAARFEEFVKQHWRTNNCAQFVRHLSLFIGPTTLKEADIEFSIHCAGPGDMIVTNPGQYHMVANFTDCFAMSINFLLPGEKVIPDDLAVCEQCGLFSLAHKGFRAVSSPLTYDETERLPVTSISENEKLQPKKRAVLRQAAGPLRPCKKQKSTPMSSSASRELTEAEEQIKKVDPLCIIPSFGAQPPSSEVFKLAAVIYSRLAIRQFCSLIRSRRDLDTESFRMNLSQDIPARVGQRLGRIDVFLRKTDLGRLCARLETFYLAQDIDNSKDGRIRADPAVIKKILKQTKCSKKTLERYRSQGNKWRRLCDGYKGLLCLIFLDGGNSFRINPDSYTSLEEADVHMFQDLLNSPYISALCSVAKTFQRSLDSTSYDVEFCWEAGKWPLDSTSCDVEFRWEAEKQPLEKLPENYMLTLLQPLPSAPENIFDPDKYQDWPRPPSWLEEWPWPADPTAILGVDDKKCDFCDEEKCACVRKSTEHKPRIKHYGKKGRGLQAVACKQGRMAYQKGDIVGFITGRIVPPDTYHDSWTLDFVRPDLADEPVVCQIRFADAGNCFRLLNHSCNPSARFVQMRASGRYSTAVKASRNISDGEEITVSYGSKWAGEHCLCEVHQK